MGTRSKERSKRQICEAALDCYAESGAERVSLAEIAKRAGVQPPLIHYHFPEPGDLFRGVVELIVEELRESVTEPLRAAGRGAARQLDDYVDAYFRWIKRRPERFAVWLHFYYVAAVDPGFREANTRIRETGRGRIEEIILRGLASGEFKLPKGCSTLEAAAEIQSSLTGACILAATEDGFSSKEARDLVLRQTRRLVGLKG